MRIKGLWWITVGGVVHVGKSLKEIEVRIECTK